MEIQYIGMACALGISAVGSVLGAGSAALSSVGAWKKCYAKGKPASFLMVAFSGAPLTQTIYGFLLMNFIKSAVAGGASQMLAMFTGIFAGLAIGMSAFFQLVDMQLKTVQIVIVGAVAAFAERQHCAGANHQWQRHKIMVFLNPSAANGHSTIQQIGPLALRQVILRQTVLAEDGRDQQPFTQHILAIERFAGKIVREFQHHWPHHGNALFMRFEHCAHQIRHQAAFELRKLPHHFHTFLIEKPRYAIAA